VLHNTALYHPPAEAAAQLHDIRVNDKSHCLLCYAGLTCGLGVTFAALLRC
jgi:hypothetical protein